MPVRETLSYLLLRCRAEQIALRDSSVGLVIATPPYFGARGVRTKDCCPVNPESYSAFLERCLKEATRVVKPGGYILIHCAVRISEGVNDAHRFVFRVLKKSSRRARLTVTFVRAEGFRARLVRIKGIRWYGLPVWLYRSLINRYSSPGARILHLFSGTGNSAIAALRLSRLPILIDLHHHRQVRRRLNKLFGRHQGNEDRRKRSGR